MITLSDNEAIKYNGGGKISAGLVIIISAIGSFILGVIDGLSNPKACNSSRL